jgi:DNA-binding LacI/PurR family transcriptional regulator
MISSHYNEADVRLDAYNRAMHEAGYGDYIESHVCYDFSKDSDPTYWNNGQSWIPCLEMARRLLEKIELPASIISFHDNTARAIYEVAKERGLTIGKDLYIVSHGDDPSAKLMDPPLTSVALNGKQIGWEAAKLLRCMIDNPAMEPVHIHVPVKLIDRKSS